MKTRPDAVCEWKHCDASASKHVWYGLPVREAAGRAPMSELPYTTEDKDLCRKHIAEVGRQYVHVTEFELE